jgi:nitronate monooxygenase
VAALALGAEGVVLGTRFLATPEAAAHPIYKQKVLEATEEDTVRTTLFGRGWPNAPHRTLRTAFVDEWLKDEARGSEQRVDEPVIGESIFGGERLPLQRFAGFPPTAEATGDIESMGLLAGQGVGLVTDLKPAAVIIREIVMRRCLEKKPKNIFKLRRCRVCARSGVAPRPLTVRISWLSLGMETLRTQLRSGTISFKD